MTREELFRIIEKVGDHQANMSTAVAAVDAYTAALLQQTPCSTQLPPSGIEEFDELIKQFQNKEIDFLTLTSRLWNKGYEAGKDYCSGGN